MLQCNCSGHCVQCHSATVVVIVYNVTVQLNSDQSSWLLLKVVWFHVTFSLLLCEICDKVMQFINDLENIADVQSIK